MVELKEIPFDRIRIPEVRVSSILTEEQKALMGSTIKEVGVVQDPVVRALPDGYYELIGGRSRILELQAQGHTKALFKVVETEEKTALIMNIVENVARGSYDYISISRSIRRLRQLGASLEELERVFPWRRRWIEFLEELQDLPGDAVAAISAGRLTPTHVQLALELPTPYEQHDGLRTALNLRWDTGTFRVFVQNRVEQIERARRQAAEQGLPPEIPPVVPDQLIQYKQCLCCGYKKPREQVTVQSICEGCLTLAKYITSQLGVPEEAINTVYAALSAYYGQPQPQAPRVTPPGGAPSPG